MQTPLSSVSATVVGALSNGKNTASLCVCLLIHTHGVVGGGDLRNHLYFCLTDHACFVHSDVCVKTFDRASAGIYVCIIYIYVGKSHLKNEGTVFWNSSNPPVSPGGLFTYTFDAAPRQLIVGFDVGSYGMAVGETRVLCIPPAEGYGNKDRKDGSGNVIIPANSTLLFTLTCAKISAPATTAQAL